MSQNRRLAAILAADVAGYSRLMGADEEGTLERLKVLRAEVIDPNIASHRGLDRPSASRCLRLIAKDCDQGGGVDDHRGNPRSSYSKSA
jgi:class 3 adenylate cyclase